MFRALLLLLSCLALTTSAFVVVTPQTAVITASSASSPTARFIFKKKKDDDEDLSYIETRDMTREEMFELNKKNEDIMNAELIGMTIFSLILSIPMLYLVWVGFFSETVEFGEL